MSQGRQAAADWTRRRRTEQDRVRRLARSERRVRERVLVVVDPDAAKVVVREREGEVRVRRQALEDASTLARDLGPDAVATEHDDVEAGLGHV